MTWPNKGHQPGGEKAALWRSGVENGPLDPGSTPPVKEWLRDAPARRDIPRPQDDPTAIAQRIRKLQHGHKDISDMAITSFHPDKVLNCEVDCDDFIGTIRDYLKKLLLVLWAEQEEFSGKRPFGNSGWDHDLHYALVKAGLVSGRIESDGDLTLWDEETSNHMIRQAIHALR